MFKSQYGKCLSRYHSGRDQVDQHARPWNVFDMKSVFIYLFLLLFLASCGNIKESSENAIEAQWLIDPPEKGFVTSRKATKWEEALLTGNGTTGAVVMSEVNNERLIVCHERLFMPQYPPFPAPDLGSRLGAIRELLLDGKNEEAVAQLIEAGAEVGIVEDYMLWTDPLVPACQIEIVNLDEHKPTRYNRATNYESGEASVTWISDQGTFQRDVFSSRPDTVIVARISSPDHSKINTRIRLNQLPVNQEENAQNQEFNYDELIEEVSSEVNADGLLKYKTIFNKKWDGSLKGYLVETLVKPTGGEMNTDGDWLMIQGADEVTLFSKVLLFSELPVNESTNIQSFQSSTYESLLAKHQPVQREMFNRFSLKLGEEPDDYVAPEDLLASSSPGNLNPQLLVKLCEAARYELISSTGEIPPSLQGIWGGTWLPAWSGDFTLNGNVPSAIASGLNTNFKEVTEAYINYMWGFMDDFRFNAQGLFGAPGIFVPSRSSSSGRTYHYGNEHPHLFWFAGGAWTSQFFYDYWQYTGNEGFLNEKALPLMLEAMEFYEFIITKGDDGEYMFIPSYSPEVGPLNVHPLTINATMDVAALKGLIRNLLTLAEEGYLETDKTEQWQDILENLPDYQIDEDGDLKEWLWGGYKNDNAHRHASHLYPLFYEVDPDFRKDPELQEAAKVAIDNRLQYRRGNDGGEMAFGLVQIGLAAAHIGATELAYDCVDYLCNAYWSPAFTSYHDPGAIFNVDISGGLPALVAEMLVQSSSEQIHLLPALPKQWPRGEVKGIGTRAKVNVDLTWKAGKPVRATFTALQNAEFTLVFADRSWDITVDKGQRYEWTFN